MVYEESVNSEEFLVEAGDVVEYTFFVDRHYFVWEVRVASSQIGLITHS
jgi:hypothetical protein